MSDINELRQRLEHAKGELVSTKNKVRAAHNAIIDHDRSVQKRNLDDKKHRSDLINERRSMQAELSSKEKNVKDLERQLDELISPAAEEVEERLPDSSPAVTTIDDESDRDQVDGEDEPTSEDDSEEMNVDDV